MRFLLYLFFAAAFLLDGGFGTCSSCRSLPPPTPPSTISWDAAGVSWRSDAVSGSRLPTTAGLTATGGTTTTPAPTIIPTLGLVVPLAVGTYVLSASSEASAQYEMFDGTARHQYYAGAQAGALVGSGTIVVTSLSTNLISGTFEFTVVDGSTGATQAVHNGTFSVNL